MFLLQRQWCVNMVICFISDLWLHWAWESLRKKVLSVLKVSVIQVSMDMSPHICCLLTDTRVHMYLLNKWRILYQHWADNCLTLYWHSANTWSAVVTTCDLLYLNFNSSTLDFYASNIHLCQTLFFQLLFVSHHGCVVGQILLCICSCLFRTQVKLNL